MTKVDNMTARLSLAVVEPGFRWVRAAAAVALAVLALPAMQPAAADEPRVLAVVTPTIENVTPYGTLLGGTPFPVRPGATPLVQSQRQALFDPGEGGKTEVVWVEYRTTNPLINRLEKHTLTEQTVSPLTGTIIQILALSGPDDKPDLATLRAFRLTPGVGINMGRGVWHTTRSTGSTVLMLSRSSTTDDILRAGKDHKPLIETIMVDVTGVQLPADAL